MAATHFKITKLPSSDIVSVIGADLLQKDLLYPISRQNEIRFSRVPELEGYYVKDEFHFITHDEVSQRYSNTSIGSFQWKETDLNTIPASDNVILDKVDGEFFNILSELPINKAVEFIEVISIEGVNNTELNGLPIIGGDRLSPSELSKALLSVYSGGGLPYLNMIYKVGRENSLEATEYELTINVDSIALITSKPVVNSLYVAQDEGGFDIQRGKSIMEFNVEGAHCLKDVLLDITLNHSWLGTGNNETEFNIAGEVIYKTDSDNFQATAKADSLGKIKIEITTDFEYTGNPFDGNVSIEILSVDNGNGSISPTNNIATSETHIPDEL